MRFELDIEPRGFIARLFKRKKRDSAKVLISSLHRLIAESTFQEDNMSNVIKIAFEEIRGAGKLGLAFWDNENGTLEPYLSYSIEKGNLVSAHENSLHPVTGMLNLSGDNTLGMWWDANLDRAYIFNLIPGDDRISNMGVGRHMGMLEGSGMVLPMIFQKRLMGMLSITGENIRFDGDIDREPYYMILYAASLSRIIATNIKMQTDPLTKLGTVGRFDVVFRQIVSKGIQSTRPTTLIYIDGDNFKSINDTYGHDAGDMVLRAIAKRMLDSTRELERNVFRLGGEEFAIPLEENTDSAIRVARRISEAMLSPVRITDNSGMTHEISVSVSIGISSTEFISVNPNPEEICAHLRKTADNAMYNAKQEYGKGCIVARVRDDCGNITMRKIS